MNELSKYLLETIGLPVDIKEVPEDLSRELGLASEITFEEFSAQLRKTFAL